MSYEFVEQQCFLGHLNGQRTNRLLLTIQHYKGCSNIDSTGNYEWFFTSLRERTLRPWFPGSLNYGMFAFLKIKLLLVEIAHRGSPQGSLNKFAWNERAWVNSDRDFPPVRYGDVSSCASLNKDGFAVSCCRFNSPQFLQHLSKFSQKLEKLSSRRARLEYRNLDRRSVTKLRTEVWA